MQTMRFVLRPTAIGSKRRIFRTLLSIDRRYATIQEAHIVQQQRPVAITGLNSVELHKIGDFQSPAPLRIIEAHSDQHTFTLNERALERLLLDPRIADRKVMLVSVAGAFRKGKSFLLNFFLRFLHASHEQRVSGAWLGQESDRLSGFSWRNGCERETSGMLIWSEPFLMRDEENGEDVVLLLMDTQGAFDPRSTVKDCATVFALSTMVSSIQIYNLSQIVQENDLQHLQLFTEYARLALASGVEGKPFQSLLFLVRDWSYPYEFPYGFDGGDRFLESLFKDKHHPELQQSRERIRACFANIHCCLMPHPGQRVSTSEEFDGRISDIDAEFKKQLKFLVPRLLTDPPLVLKAINGTNITCRQLLEYFRAYVKTFQGQTLPEPKTVFWATAEANNYAAVAVARAIYDREMNLLYGDELPHTSDEQLADHHERCRQMAVGHFRSTPKMGGDAYSQSYLDHLEQSLKEQHALIAHANSGKRVRAEAAAAGEANSTMRTVLSTFAATVTVTAAHSAIAGPIGFLIGIPLGVAVGAVSYVRLRKWI